MVNNAVVLLLPVPAELSVAACSPDEHRDIRGDVSVVADVAALIRLLASP
jgi:hypothetical protein